MKYLRRGPVVIAIAASSALVLSACGSSDGGGGEEVAADAEQTLNVWGWSGAPGADVMADVIEAFEAANPTITVNYNEIVNTDYANKATLGLSSGEDIDVIGVFPNEWAQDNESYLVPVEEWPGAEGILDAFQPQAVEQVQRLFSDGVARAVPLNSNGSAVGFYNVDMLEEAGFTEPPATWAEMKDLADALAETAPDAITALIPSDYWFQSDILQSLIGQYDPQFWNTLVYQDGPWDTPAVRDAFAAYQAAFVDGALDPATLDVQYADAKSLFGQGQAAVIFSGTWDSGLLLESFRDANGIDASDVGVMPLPADDPEARGVRAFLDTTYGIPESSDKKAAAAAFIQFMTAGDGVDAWARALVGVPVVANWTLPDDVLATDAAKAGYETIQALIADPHSDRYVLSNFENQQGSYLLEVAAGNLGPDQAAEQGQADLESGKYN